MSQLYNCSDAVVPIEKIERYLLNPSHPEGASKARFFSKFGYSVANSIDFRRALLKVACQGKVVHSEYRPPFGTRVTTIGKLGTPDRRDPLVKIGWFFDQNDHRNIPRLITVIPWTAR